ncbi:MAG: hypothetical protein GY780_01480 [bacterium]|nr:hypothetical protein [bacterium]
MNNGFYNSSDLARIHDLPADHPDRDHLKNCVSCRTELASFERFLFLGEQSPDEIEIEAEKKLTAFLDNEILDSENLISLTANRWKLPRKFSLPLASAAVLLLSFGVFQTELFRETNSPGVVLRAGQNQELEQVLTLGKVSLTTDNRVKLTWLVNTPDANFQVVIYDRTLAPIATISASRNNELYLDSDPWLARLSQGTDYFWRVQIVLNGDVLQESVLEPLVVP